MAKKKNTTRKDGRVAVRVFYGRDSDGKKQYKSVYGSTQKEADEKALQLKLAMRKGLDITADNDTFGKWADIWFGVKEPEVSPGRAMVYKSHIKHLNSHLEYAAITKIRTADVQSIITSLAAKNPNTGKPMARETLAGLKSTALQIFQLAIDNRVMDYNPARPVRLPNTPPPSPRRALTDEEQRWITDTPHRAQRAAMIMMYAGLRRGELIPLTWNDIDLHQKTISVTKATTFVGGKAVIKAIGKNEHSIRTIDIPDRLADFLRDEPHESIYVCVTGKGTLHTEASWRKMWNSYMTDLNLKYGDFRFLDKQPKSKFQPEEIPMLIPQITPHWLRHTFATMLYFAGVDILSAMNQLGHKDIKTTLAIYTHLDAIHKRKSMDKLNSYLNDKSSDVLVK